MQSRRERGPNLPGTEWSLRGPGGRLKAPRGGSGGVAGKLIHKLIKTDVAITVHVQLVEQFLQLLGTVTIISLSLNKMQL